MEGGGWGLENADFSLRFQGGSLAGPAGVLSFDILVCEDGKLNISGVKLLLEITETLCLKVYPCL